MTVSRKPSIINMSLWFLNWAKKLLNPSKRLQIPSGSLKRKLFNCILLETISVWRKLSQIYKTSFFCLILIPNMIFASIGKNYNRNLLTQSLSTTKQSKDLKCITTQLLTICLESSHKYQDFWRNFQILRPIILLILDILKLSETKTNLMILVFLESSKIFRFVPKCKMKKEINHVTKNNRYKM